MWIIIGIWLLLNIAPFAAIYWVNTRREKR
jgi:hypothetical protein